MLTRDEAFELLKKYNKEDFHIHHGKMVEGTMRYFAEKLGYGDDVDFWGIVGLLHDIDFEMWPEEHCKKAPVTVKSSPMIYVSITSEGSPLASASALLSSYAKFSSSKE